MRWRGPPREWRWRWRHWRARHYVWSADLAYRRWPSPANRDALRRAVDYLGRTELGRP